MDKKTHMIVLTLLAVGFLIGIGTHVYLLWSGSGMDASTTQIHSIINLLGFALITPFVAMKGLK